MGKKEIARGTGLTFVILSVSTMAAAEPPHWHVPFDKNDCHGNGLRQWSSQLHDGGSHEDQVCASLAATIDGQSFSGATRCAHHPGGLWGEFDLADSSCAAAYSDFSTACVGDGIRRYTGTLTNVDAVGGWARACASVPLNFDGQPFAHATYCNERDKVAYVETHSDVCRNARPVSVCRPATAAGAVGNDLSSADLMLFVVAPNHKDFPNWGNLDSASVERIADRINDAYQATHFDLAKVVIVMSETGGCTNCGWAASALPTGAAHTLSNRLNALLHRTFDVRRAIPNLATDYFAMPALISGGYWAMPPGVNFIGHDYPSVGRLGNDSTRRYARAVLKSADGTSIGFSAVHVSPTNNDLTAASHRQIELGDLMNEIAASGAGENIDFIAGDFNVALGGHNTDGSAYLPPDSSWISQLKHTASFVTSGQACRLPNGTNAVFYSDIINAAEFTRNGHQMVPVGFVADAPFPGENATDILHVQGVMHPVLGIAFKRAP